MKYAYILGILLIAIALVFCAGCTNSQSVNTQSAPPQTDGLTPTQLPAIATIETPVPTPTPYPNALAMNQQATFGKTDRTGTSTVNKIKLVQDYSYSDPTFNSPREQPQAGDPLSTQMGYNTKKPAAGNAFLFVYVRITDTGTKGLVAPSPKQFTVNYDGKDYSYSSIVSSDVTLGEIQSPQYDYAIGRGGEAGYINPGDSNAADGYLIYEVPAGINLTRASLVIQLDSENRYAWVLG